MNRKGILIVVVIPLFFHQSYSMSRLVADSHSIFDVSHISPEQIQVIRDRDELGNKRLTLMTILDPCYALICIKTGEQRKSLLCAISFEEKCRFYRNLSNFNHIENLDYVEVSTVYYDVLLEKAKQSHKRIQ